MLTTLIKYTIRFKKDLANIETKKGHEKNKALAVASCI